MPQAGNTSVCATLRPDKSSEVGYGKARSDSVAIYASLRTTFWRWLVFQHRRPRCSGTAGRPRRSASKRKYPFVLKLSAGYQATNVRMVHSPHDTLFYVDELFGPGLVSLRPESVGGPRRFFRRFRAAVSLAGGWHQNRPNSEAELHHGYFYAQEFLPGNTFDTRVTVIDRQARIRLSSI